jgi:hypothetical protein
MRLKKAAVSEQDEKVDEVDLTELRSALYGLHAILKLHTTQEDENYPSLADEPK